MKPKILSKKVEYECDWIKVERARIRLLADKVVKWERIILSDAVAIVAVDNQNNIYLSKEWRFTWEKEVLQIPAGACKEKTEKGILQQARNELREEIGLDAKKWEKLTTCLLSARIKMKVHIFLARDLFESKKKEDDDEIIEVVKMPFQKAYELFLSGKELTPHYTVLGMTLAKEKLNL